MPSSFVVERLDKYTIARSAIDAALERAQGAQIDPSDLIDALLVSVVERSIKLRGAKPTRDSLTYELSTVRGETDLQFLRSR